MAKETITLPDMSSYKLRRDRFRQSRGSTSQMLDISCSSCDNELMVYQKDGQGNLYRCYLDRIAWPPELVTLNEESNVKDIPPLNCGNCETLIGTPMVYEAEDRLAYRIVPGTIRKTIYKSPKLEIRPKAQG